MSHDGERDLDRSGRDVSSASTPNTAEREIGPSVSARVARAYVRRGLSSRLASIPGHGRRVSLRSGYLGSVRYLERVIPSLWALRLSTMVEIEFQIIDDTALASADVRLEVRFAHIG